MNESPSSTEAPVVALSDAGQPQGRALPDPRTQVGTIVTRLIEEARERNTKNARITSKLNSERPHRTSELEAAGLGWKVNITTRPLATLTQRVYARFPRAVSAARSLTSAALPPETPNGPDKTKFFQKAITDFVRADPRWVEVVEGLAWESVTFGYTAAVWPDEERWLPVACRQDEIFVPTGTKQHASTASVFVYRQDPLVHEAARLLDAATKAKAVEGARFEWDIPNLIATLREATPSDQKPATTEHLRDLEDLRRQLSVANAFGTGNKTVTIYNLLVVELSGRVSHYAVNDKKQFLFAWEDRFASMSEAVSFFAFELGDRTLRGSKGVGRVAYSVASVLDRSTCDVVDRFALSGKVVAKAPTARHRQFRVSVVGNFVLLDDNFELVPQAKFEASVAEGVALDQFLQAKLDSMTGSVSPQHLEGDRVTAAAVNLLAGRESERADEYMNRWMQQVGYMMTEVVRRLVLVPTTDPSVGTLRAKLRTRLSEEEIRLLATTPAMTTVHGWTASERQLIVTACSEGVGNPVYDQRALAVAKVNAMVGPDLAAEIVLPTEDPTVIAEQTRTQMLENGALLDGMEIPVSPRDAHLIHLQGMTEILSATLQELAQNPDSFAAAKAVVGHGLNHAMLGQQAGIPGIDQFVQAYQQASRALAELVQTHQQEAAQKAEDEQALLADQAKSDPANLPGEADVAESTGLPVMPAEVPA